jgi:hypothetical protein
MRTVVAILVFVAAAPGALADGKFFIGEGVPPDLPYQRAVLFFTGDREALVLQSRWAFPGGATTAPEIEWVVPVPAVPEVGALDAGAGDQLFWSFDVRSGADVTHVLPVLLLTLAVLLILGILVLVIRAVRLRGGPWSVPLVLALLLIAVLLGNVTLILPKGLGGGVEVLRDEVAGPYRVRVVRAADAGELEAWLAQAGFSTGAAERAVLADYVARGWCFVTAKIRPGETAGELLTPEGIVPPLVLAFPTAAPVYPLALTGTGGGETEVVLWAVAPHRVESDGRLTTRYAGRTKESRGDNPWTPSGAPEFLRDPCRSQPWLTKLKDRLRPEQMRTDLVLRYADADEPMCERIFRW